MQQKSPPVLNMARYMYQLYIKLATGVLLNRQRYKYQRLFHFDLKIIRNIYITSNQKLLDVAVFVNVNLGKVF